MNGQQEEWWSQKKEVAWTWLTVHMMCELLWPNPKRDSEQSVWTVSCEQADPSLLRFPMGMKFAQLGVCPFPMVWGVCALAQCCLWGRMVCSGSKEMLLYPYTSATSHKFALLKGVLLFSLWYSFLTFDSCYSVHICMCVCIFTHACTHAFITNASFHVHSWDL